MKSTVLPLSSLYDEAIYFSLRQQVPWAFLNMLLLDGGRMAWICGVTMLGFWAAVALIMVRRPHFPSSIDIMFLRWGFFPFYGLFVGLDVALDHFA